MLDEEFYIPNSLKLNNINLKIQHGILSSDSYKERMELIRHNFEKIKNKFRVHSSNCAKEIAELKHKNAIERQDQNIIKQFLLMITHYVRMKIRSTYCMYKVCMKEFEKQGKILNLAQDQIAQNFRNYTISILNFLSMWMLKNLSIFVEFYWLPKVL